eukprot:PhF_6_TR41104/c0_g1_i1/m.62253
MRIFLVALLYICLHTTEALVTEFSTSADFRREVFGTDAAWLVLFYNSDAGSATLRDEFRTLATEYADMYRFGAVDVTLKGGLAIADEYNAMGEGLPLIKAIMYEGRDFLKNWSVNGGVEPIANLRIAIGKVSNVLKRSNFHGYYVKEFPDDAL